LTGEALKRVATREYVPLAALVLTWLAIGATIGHADAVRLLAALTFVRAARALTAPATLPLLRKRMGRKDGGRQAIRVALGVEAVALCGALVALAGILGFLSWAGGPQMVLLALLFAPALPARFVMPLTAARSTAGLYRPSLAFMGLGVAAAGWLLGADEYGLAMLFAAREWLALAAAYLLAPPRRRMRKRPEPLNWRDIANRSHARGRKNAAYRFSKIFLHALLGPFGSVAARTGRGLRVDRKLERFVPHHPAVLGLVAVGLTAASGALIVLIPEPALLLAAASLLRTAASAGNILIWGWLATEVQEADDEDDEDEE
jgi:hypothetical protein